MGFVNRVEICTTMYTISNLDMETITPLNVEAQGFVGVLTKWRSLTLFHEHPLIKALWWKPHTKSSWIRGSWDIYFFSAIEKRFILIWSGVTIWWLEVHLVFCMLAKTSPISTTTPDTWTCQAHHPRSSQEASKLTLHVPKWKRSNFSGQTKFRWDRK